MFGAESARDNYHSQGLRLFRTFSHRVWQPAQLIAHETI